MTLGKVIDLFLAALAQTVAPATCDWYAGYLGTLHARFGRTEFAKLTPSDILDWLQERYGDKSANSRVAAVRAFTRLQNWAWEEKLIDEKPIRKLRKPTPTHRTTYVTPAQYAQCVKAIRRGQRAHLAGPIIDVVKFLWHTGCRPQELRMIRADWIHGSMIVIPAEFAKGKTKARTIFLNGPAAKIAARLSAQWPNGPIFRDTRGKAWSKGGLGLAFRRLRLKTKIDGLCAYSFRHGYVTRLLERGVDIATTAALAGHQPRMTMAVYSHVGDNHDRLSAIVNASG